MAAVKILVIRRDNIGDLVCTTPLLHALRQAHPTAWIAVLANTYNAPVLNGNPDVDAVFVYQKAKHRAPGKSRLGVWCNTIGLLWHLRRARIDVAICPSPGARRLARLAGVRRILERDFSASGHEVEVTLALGRSLGVTGQPGPVLVRVDPDRVERLASRLPLPTVPGRTVAFHVSARKPAQRWPAGHFAALGRTLLASGRAARILVFWAPGKADNPRHPGDDEKAQEIIAAMASARISPVPTGEVGELVAGLSLADIVICSDGGAMHIAAGLGKPIVAFFGNSDPAHWRPWGVPHRVLQPTSRHVADITVEEVLAAYDALCNEVGDRASAARTG